MTDDEYRSRIQEIERHYDQRAWRYGGRGDLLISDAQDCIAYLSEIVSADYYREERPNTERALLKQELTKWDERWRHR